MEVLTRRAQALDITRTCSVVNLKHDSVVLCKSKEYAPLINESHCRNLLVVCHIGDERYFKCNTHTSEYPEYEFVLFHNSTSDCFVTQGLYHYTAGRGCFCSEGVRVVDGLKLIKTPTGTTIQMRHTGDVQFGEGVIVHANTVIHRAVFDSTIIGSYVRIGSLCNIGHNVHIGDNSLIMSGVNIGGSVKIGENCFIGLNAVILPKVEVCDNVKIGANSTVTKSIRKGGVYVGSPARRTGDWDGKW